MPDTRSLFVLGSGRSGTSTVAGLFRSSGFFQGTNMIRPSVSNPLGYFEDFEVNDINERILAPHVPERTQFDGLTYGADAPTERQRWLARVPTTRAVHGSPEDRARIASYLPHQPFCLKDPRFCYTLKVWREFAPEARMICVFRPAPIVASSILHELRNAIYLSDLAMSVHQIVEMWSLCYSYVLQHHSKDGEWLFVEYSDLFDPNVLVRIGAFAGVQVDATFPAKTLDRSRPVEINNLYANEIYKELRERSRETLWGGH